MNRKQLIKKLIAQEKINIQCLSLSDFDDYTINLLEAYLEKCSEEEILEMIVPE